MGTTESTKPKTPVMRVSYARVFTPKKDDKDRDVYSITALIPKQQDISDMWKHAREAVLAKFPKAEPTKDGKWFKNIKSPIRDGDEDDAFSGRPECKNMWVVGMRSYNRKPEVRANDADKTPLTSDDEFYSGCIAVASYSMFAYLNDTSKGVSCGLGNILKIRDGKKLTSATTADEDFKEVGVEQYVADNSEMFNEAEESEEL